MEKSRSTEDMLDMVERVQGDRMNEQRSDLPTDEDPSLISTSDYHPLVFSRVGSLCFKPSLSLGEIPHDRGFHCFQTVPADFPD